MTPQKHKLLTIGLAALALWLMFTLALTSLRDDSPTFDEQGFLVRGLAYLRGEANGGSRIIRVGHPLGLNALNAALLVDDPAVRLPSDDPSWRETNFHRPAELFLWEIGNDVQRTMFLARVPTLWLGLLLAAVGGRWAREMVAGWGVRCASSRWAGLIALVLLTLDPNILAHTRLVTTDLGLAAGAVLAGYTLWRFLRRPSWVAAVVAGAGLGLLQNTKFTALLFVPLFGLLMALAFWGYLREKRQPLARLAVMALLVYPGVALLTLWATNGFQIGVLTSPLPVIGTLGGVATPLSHYLDQLADIGGRMQVSTPAFLMGQHSDSGWWYYFPVAFVLKTPLPVVLLLAIVLIRIAIITVKKQAYPGQSFDLAALLIPGLGYFVFALTTDINLGYRHLLPVLPFLYVLVGAVFGAWAGRGAVAAGEWPRDAWLARGLPAAALAWLLVASLWIHPHYLSYFNVLAGGPDNGWRALVDSNIDWGQDLGRLRGWVDARGVERLWLSYFGEGRPEYYGIAYRGLDSFPPRLMNPLARPFFPPDPTPGWYAISATTLQGVHFDDPDLYRTFRDRRPDDKVGYSIFLYEVLARGEPVELLLSNVQLDAIAAEDYALLGTNDTRPRWFDGRQAVIIPRAGGETWLVLGDHEALHPLLAHYLKPVPGTPTAENETYELRRVTHDAPSDAGRMFSLNSSGVAFLEAPRVEVGPDGASVVTVWRRESAPSPVKLFVHILDDDGRIAAQWDGLGAAWEGWRPGDTLVQLHAIDVPHRLASGRYRVTTGLYDPETNQRWRLSDGQDVVELGTFSIP